VEAVEQVGLLLKALIQQVVMAEVEMGNVLLYPQGKMEQLTLAEAEAVELILHQATIKVKLAVQVLLLLKNLKDLI